KHMLGSSDKANRVKQVYTDLNRKYEEEETQRKAQEQNIAYLNLYGYAVDTQVLGLLPKEIAEANRAVVFYKEGRNLKLGVVDATPSIAQVLKHLTEQAFTVEPYLISQSSFDHAFAGYSKIIKNVLHSDSIKLQSDDKRFQIGNIKEIGQRFGTASATDIIQNLIGSALHIDASDIHAEPEKTELKIRYRIDGVLQDVASVSMDVHHQLVSRIKILSKMKLN